jgi:hypothetical protein
MYKDISDRERMIGGFDISTVLHDRNDVYMVLETRRCEDRLAVRIYYELVQINCNPDFDW